MDKLTLILALGAYVLGGYAAYDTLTREDPVDVTSLASVQDLDALRTEVATLRETLAQHDRDLTGAKAANEERKAGHTSAAARIAALEDAAAEGGKRLATLAGRVATAEKHGAALVKRIDEAKGVAPTGAISVRELEIKNAAGNVVVRLGANGNGGGEVVVRNRLGKRAARLMVRQDDDGELRLYDETDVLRTTVGANAEGGYANFYSRAGDLAAYIGGDAEADAGYVSVFGKGEKKAIELYAHEKGGIIGLRNVLTDKRVTTVGVAKDTGTGVCALGSPAGKTGVLLYTTSDGGQVTVQNNKDERVAFLGASSDPGGNGLLYIAQENGKRIGEIGVNASSGGYLSMKNHKDERVIFMGAATGESEGDGVLEVARQNGKLGVVLRAYSGGSSVRVYDIAEKVVKQLR